MSKRNSLESFALFYEQIKNSKVPNDTTEERKSNSYDKAPSLTDDDVYKLSDDVQHPMQKSSKSNPLQ